MKNVVSFKSNIRVLENLVCSMSKGYYSTFNEYNPDRSEEDENNDHTVIEEENDHFNPNGDENRNSIK